MTASTVVVAAAAGPKYGHLYWERIWRMNGIAFVALSVVVFLIYGIQPGIGASQSDLASFYEGNAARILIASVIAGLNILNLMWFAAAIRTTLADAGQDGWGAAATAASSAIGAMFFLSLTVSAVLAYSIAGSGDAGLTTALNDLTWIVVVISSFPRAMLIMAAAFGFWRAGLISNGLFGAGLLAVLLGVLGGTTWLADGLWAPDGLYSRYIWPAVGLLAVLVASRVLARAPSTRSGF